MRLRLLLALWLMVFSSTAQAADVQPSMEDKMVAATVKSLAKAYIATADIEKLKQKNIDKLSTMNEAWFRKKYEDSYETLKDLPVKLKDRYGITEHMTREQAISAIKTIDKKRIYEEIDMVPDALIAEQVRLHLQQDEPNSKSTGMMEKVGGVWNGVVKKLNREDGK